MNFPCETNKLDNIINKKIHLIKIDVEGHEWELIDGATKTIIKHRPIIILETFKRNNNIKKIKQFILSFNYTASYISADNYLLLPN